MRCAGTNLQQVWSQAAIYFNNIHNLYIICDPIMHWNKSMQKNGVLIKRKIYVHTQHMSLRVCLCLSRVTGIHELSSRILLLTTTPSGEHGTRTSTRKEQETEFWGRRKKVRLVETSIDRALLSIYGASGNACVRWHDPKRVGLLAVLVLCEWDAIDTSIIEVFSWLISA